MRPEFLFNDEHAEFEATVAQLARRDFYDGYLSRATSEAFPSAELRRLGEHHLLDLALPESVGGQAVGPIALGIACEQVSYSDFNLGYLVFAAHGAGTLVDTLPDGIGARTARAVGRGEEVIAVGLTEPRGGSDAARPALRARRVGGGYLLSGEKTSVTLGSHARELLVVATVAPALGSKGTIRLLVDASEPTITRQRFSDPGFRPLGRVALGFEDTYVPLERELVPPPSRRRTGVAAVIHGFDLSRILLGLMVIGAARRAMDVTRAWVVEREAFGKAISHYQGVSFTLAEHDTKLEAARWLCYRALALRAARQAHTREAAMCKWWAPRLAMDAINDCIVLHGHVGWSMEMPLVQLMLDVSGLQIGDGTPQIQKLVIARQLLGRDNTD